MNIIISRDKYAITELEAGNYKGVLNSCRYVWRLGFISKWNNAGISGIPRCKQGHIQNFNRY